MFDFYILTKLHFSISGPGRGERCDDEPDFARPLSNKVPHAKKGPSSVSSVGSASSTKKSLGLSKAASGTGRFSESLSINGRNLHLFNK